MPPFAVESSFVRTTPVRPTASWNAFAWARPFWPVVASRTKNVSTHAPGIRLSMTRRTLDSSSIRFDFVWRRPAVSAIRMSAWRATAASRASNTTAAGSAFGAWATISESVRWAQIRSWSMAAARNVSAAASTTRRPCARSRAASLPMVVVLPVPLTPTTSTMAGAPSAAGTGSQCSASRTASSPASSARTAASAGTSLRLRARSTRSIDSAAPTSPVIRVSSISSQSAPPAAPKAPRSRAPNPMRDFSSPASSCSRSRSRRAASAFSGL